MRIIERIKLKNLLSFGPKGIDLELRDLNLLIGPNGSGKSNLIEAISLLKAMPSDLTVPILEEGGIRDWLWLGNDQKAVSGIIEANMFSLVSGQSVRHQVELQMMAQQFRLAVEIIEDVELPGHGKPKVYYHSQNGHGYFQNTDKRLSLKPEDVDAQQSILSQRWDPKQNRQIDWLAQHYKRFGIYRDWKLGPAAPARQPQKTDLPNDRLLPDCRNLVMVLNRLRKNRRIKQQLIDYMRKLMDGLVDFDVSIEGGTAQLFLHEGNFDNPVPATRLSDGTLRYLCLLAILLDPDPPCLVCIEEPELGLHPDSIVSIGELLVDASQRETKPMQLIVTTHSDVLVDAMNDRVEDVVVCDRTDEGSQMRRLEKAELDVWRKDYSLGQLWSRGQIGGNRW